MVRSGSDKSLSCAAAAAIFAACAIAPPAHAADIPTKAPILKAAPAPTVNWSGFYLGLGGGYGMYSAESYLSTFGVPAAVNFDNGGQGFFGTVVGGFDWQFTPRIVAGVFADYDFASIKGQHWLPAGLRSEMKLSSAWSVGGRAGWLVSPSVLSYFTAGYTQARFEASPWQVATVLPLPVVTGFSPSQNFGGYFVGGGVEAMIAAGWYVRGEYRYAVYDTENVDIALPPIAPFGVAIVPEPKVQTVRAAVIKKFGWPGAPSYAAYAGTPTTAAAWTGFYLFGGLGLGVFNNDTEQLGAGIVIGSTQTYSGKGYFGTAGGGFDFAVSNRVVLGVFADFDLSNISGHPGNALLIGLAETKQDWAWAVGGRAGWLVDPTTLFYGTAGYTQAHFTGYNYLSVALPPGVVGAVSDQTYDGWFVGAGIETGLWPNWTLRTEYRYAKYGSEDLPLTFVGFPVPFPFADRTDISVQTVRSTLAYKFNWMPAPVTARY